MQHTRTGKKIEFVMLLSVFKKECSFGIPSDSP